MTIKNIDRTLTENQLFDYRGKEVELIHHHSFTYFICRYKNGLFIEVPFVDLKPIKPIESKYKIGDNVCISTKNNRCGVIVFVFKVKTNNYPTYILKWLDNNTYDAALEYQINAHKTFEKSNQKTPSNLSITDFDAILVKNYFPSGKEEDMPIYPDLGNGILKGKELENKKKLFESIKHDSYPYNYKYKTLQTLKSDGSIDYTLIDRTEETYTRKTKTPIEHLCNYGCYNAATIQLTLDKINALSDKEKEKYKSNITCLQESLSARNYSEKEAKKFIESNQRLKFYKTINTPPESTPTYAFTIDGQIMPHYVGCYINAGINFVFGFWLKPFVELIKQKLSLNVTEYDFDPFTEWLNNNGIDNFYETYSSYDIEDADNFLKIYDLLISLEDGTSSAIPQILRNEIKLAKLKSEPQEIGKVKNIVSDYDIKRNEGKPVDLLCERMKYELGIYQRLKKYTAKQLFITEESHNQQLEDKNKILTQLYNAYQESHLSGTTDDYNYWETRPIIPSLIKKRLDTDRGAHLWEYFQNLDESQKVIVSALIKDKRQHNTVVASVLAQKKDGKVVYNAYTDKWQTPYSGRYQFITPDTDFKTAIANAFDGIETDLDESIGKRINPDNPLYKFDEDNYNVVCEYGAFYNPKLDIPHLLANEIKLAKFKKSGTPENYRIDLHIAKMKERNLYGRVVAKIRDGKFSSSNIHQNLRSILTTYGVVDKYIPDVTNFVNDYKDNVFPVLQRICVLERLDMPEPSQPKFKIGDMVKPYSIGTPVKIENVYKQNEYYFYNIANHSGGYREDDLSLAGLPVYSEDSPSNTSFKIGSLLSGFSATPDTFDIEYRTIPQTTIDRYADILAQKEDWQNFYHWYFFIQKPLKFKDGTFKEGFIETSFDTYLKKNEIGSSQVRLFVKRVTNLFNFICDKCCIRYHTYRVRYNDHGIFKYLNSNRKGTGGTMRLCFDYSENAIFKKAVTMFLALLNANMDDDGNDGVVLYNYHAFKDAEYCTFEKSNQEMPSNTTFKIGSLIRYKDSDGTIYKIVDTTDKGYVVLDLSMPEPFRQRNVIPFANNNQLVEFPILFYNEIEYAKVVSKQHLNGICGIPDTDKYLACLAEHEDWHRCIVDEYTFIDKPNKIARRTDHGYIQRQIETKNKAEGEKFCEETEQLFSDIISRFPGWVTPDPIIRYTPKQGLYYRQLRFTYEENDKFLQVIPAYLAITNADISKFEFVFDKYSAAKSKCCKFEYSKTTTEIPLPEQEQKRTSPFKFDYDSHISAFIKTLDSPQAKKTLPDKIKKDFDKFYQDLFHYTDDLDDIRWIAENNYGWTIVEDTIMGGLTREIYDYLLQDPKTGDYSYNRLQLAKIYYQLLCAECGVTPSATFYEVFYPLFSNEIEYSKIKAKK